MIDDGSGSTATVVSRGSSGSFNQPGRGLWIPGHLTYWPRIAMMAPVSLGDERMLLLRCNEPYFAVEHPCSRFMYRYIPDAHRDANAYIPAVKNVLLYLLQRITGPFKRGICSFYVVTTSCVFVQTVAVPARRG